MRSVFVVSLVIIRSALSSILQLKLLPTVQRESSGQMLGLLFSFWPFPQFTMSDLTLDSMLGKGGFSVVSEVVKIHFSEGVDDVASRPAPPGEIVDDADEHDPVLLPVKENPQPTQLENDPAPMITSTFQLLDDSCANTVFEKDPHDMPSNVSKVT